MGYRGKVEAREAARRLRAENMTLADIADQLGVSKSSVSIWVRDVPFTPSKRRHGPHRRPHAQRVAKLRQIEELDAAGRTRIGTLSDEAFLAAGVALYAGEGAKRDGSVTFANTDPGMIRFFCAWLRRFFDIDESASAGSRVPARGARPRRRRGVLVGRSPAIPRSPVPCSRTGRLPTRRSGETSTSTAVRTCVYSCTRTHREIMGLVRALAIVGRHSGVAQSAEHRPVKPRC